MSLEGNIRTVAAYRYTEAPNIQTAVLHVDSVHKESNRQPDKYFFWIDKWGIVDPATGQYVHDIITPESHKNPYLGLVEFSIISQLDVWSSKPQNTVSAWISTELNNEKEYPDNKIVIHEIQESSAGQRILHNTLIIFSCSREEVLLIAQKLFPSKTKDMKSPEELRCTLIDIGETVSVADILEAISLYVPKNKNYVPMTQEARLYLGQLLVNRVPSYYMAQEMARLGVIGKYALTCVGGGGTYSSLIESNSAGLNIPEGVRSLDCTCPFCQQKVTAIIAGGIITCPRCNKSSTYTC